MADESLLEKVHGLSDLELAVLLCLISREHCLLSTPASIIDDLIQELRLISTKTFGLRPTVIECTPTTTLEDFATSLLLPQSAPSQPHSPLRSRDSYFVSQPATPGTFSSLRPSPFGRQSSTSSTIANFVIAKDLDRAPQAVQIQALELLRTRRIFTRTNVQTAPKQFVFVPVLSAERGGEGRVTKHLNDFFFVGHWHDPEDGFLNLEEAEEEREQALGREASGNESGSVSELSSSWNMKTWTQKPDTLTLISEADISQLAELAQHVQVDVDMTRYQMNIIAHLRLHRAVASGISPTATKHFTQLLHCLAPLHNLDFVTPALVGLAARKIYVHRITITTPERERSMQWGSSVGAIKALLEGVGPEEVIDDVLGMVTAPL